MLVTVEILAAGLLLVSSAAAHPVISPLDYVKRAVNPGVVIRNCNAPGQLALAYDDGPQVFFLF